MPGWLSRILWWILHAGQWLIAGFVWLLACFVSRTLMQPVARLFRWAHLIRRPARWVIVAAQPAPEPPTPEELEWSKRAAALHLDALKEIRAGAEKWAASIAAVTGAIGVVTLIKGRESLEELEHGYEVAVGVLVGAAVLLALRGIVLAALAAQGTPARIEYTGSALRDFTANEAEEAGDLLRFSRVLVVVATLVAGVAVALVWFGPEESKPPSVQLVITETGAPACGVLKAGAGDTVTVGGVPIKVSEIRSITTVPTCPEQ